jgi:hypothetical protein
LSVVEYFLDCKGIVTYMGFVQWMSLIYGISTHFSVSFISCCTLERISSAVKVPHKSTYSEQTTCTNLLTLWLMPLCFTELSHWVSLPQNLVWATRRGLSQLDTHENLSRP